MRLLLPIACLLLSVSVFAAEVQVLDDFSYDNEAALREAWEPMEGTPPAEFRPHGDKQALRIPCAFATVPNIERGSFDRKVSLNLMTAGSITFDFYCDDPTVVSYPSIYFQSGEGWYAHQFPLVKGWQHVVLPKGAFRVEGQPAGWDKVDTIRISAWKSKPVDTYCGFDNLQSRTEDLAIIRGLGDTATESRAMEDAAKRVAGLLAKSGLEFGALTDSDVAGGALSTQKLAIFAYSPRLTPEAIAQTQKYVANGGKIIVFYSLPAAMAELIGVKNPTYRSRERDGQFANVAFEPGALTGLPGMIPQNSWNVTGFEAGGHNARIIGRWQDPEGEDSGPAVLLSDNGVFMGHILTDGDAPRQAFVMSLVGHFVPEAWEAAARAALKSAASVGPFADREALDAHLAEVTPGSRFEPQVKAALAAAKTAEAEAKRLLADKKYPETLEAAADYHSALLDAYMVAHKSPEVEFRAVWNHSGTGDCGTWDEAMRRLKAANFNAVVPNMWWGGLAHYDSKLLPLSKTFKEQGDQITQCVAAGKKYGIEVHPWKVNWNLTNAPAEFIDRMRAEGRLLINSKGEEGKWLCASNPVNQQFEIDTMLEVARNYDVDGVHFDYIRYPGADGCFCKGCRERFEKRLGKPVANWPADCNGTLKEEWMQFRCDNITAVVKGVSEQVHKLKPNLKVSAAVFGDYPACKYGVGQDWVLWCKEKYLDFVCPMDYTESDTRFRNLVSNQVSLVGDSVPLYAGIGQFRIPDDRVVGQIEMSREAGADGFILFNMGQGLAEQGLPQYARGVTSAPAKLPHRK